MFLLLLFVCVVYFLFTEAVDYVVKGCVLHVSNLTLLAAFSVPQTHTHTHRHTHARTHAPTHTQKHTHTHSFFHRRVSE